MNRSRPYLLGLVLLLTAGLAGCSLFGDDDACDTRFTDTVRVIPCSGVDGVRFGDSRAEVEARLGSPDVYGWVGGGWRGWRQYTYLEGPYAGLRINYIIKEGYIDEDGYGPVDSFGMHTPYSGKTKEGIGLGAAEEAVKRVYGEPLRVYTVYLKDQEDPQHKYLYCVEDKLLQISIVRGVVTVIGFGYHIRMPEFEDARLCY